MIIDLDKSQLPLYSGPKPVEIDSLKTSLSEGIVRVEFTKLDDTHRSMLCTKNFNNIPESQVPKVSTDSDVKPRKINDSILHVFDLEKQEWRSIKIDKIQSWIIINT
jgi:hypothetical protein